MPIPNQSQKRFDAICKILANSILQLSLSSVGGEKDLDPKPDRRRHRMRKEPHDNNI